MQLSPRKNGLTSLFKEVRGFKDISTLAILILPRNGVPKTYFPKLPDQGFLWKFSRNPEFSGISRPIPISDSGVPIFSVSVGNEVDMLAVLTHCIQILFIWSNS